MCEPLAPNPVAKESIHGFCQPLQLAAVHSKLFSALCESSWASFSLTPTRAGIWYMQWFSFTLEDWQSSLLMALHPCAGAALLYAHLWRNVCVSASFCVSCQSVLLSFLFVHVVLLTHTRNVLEEDIQTSAAVVGHADDSARNRRSAAELSQDLSS